MQHNKAPNIKDESSSHWEVSGPFETFCGVQSWNGNRMLGMIGINMLKQSNAMPILNMQHLPNMYSWGASGSFFENCSRSSFCILHAFFFPESSLIFGLKLIFSILHLFVMQLAWIRLFLLPDSTRPFPVSTFTFQTPQHCYPKPTWRRTLRWCVIDGLDLQEVGWITMIVVQPRGATTRGACLGYGSAEEVSIAGLLLCLFYF